MPRQISNFHFPRKLHFTINQLKPFLHIHTTFDSYKSQPITLKFHFPKTKINFKLTQQISTNSFLHQNPSSTIPHDAAWRSHGRDVEELIKTSRERAKWRVRVIEISRSAEWHSRVLRERRKHARRQTRAKGEKKGAKGKTRAIIKQILDFRVNRVGACGMNLYRHKFQINAGRIAVRISGAFPKTMSPAAGLMRAYTGRPGEQRLSCQQSASISAVLRPRSRKVEGRRPAWT